MINGNPIINSVEENSSKANENKALIKPNKLELSISNSYAESNQAKANYNEMNGDKDNDNYQSLRHNEVKDNLRKIFMNIARYSSKENNYYITQQTLNKLLKDSNNLEECGVRLCEVDLMFQRVTSPGIRMNFEQFLNFLIRLSKKIFPDEFSQNPKGTVDFFFCDFFEKFANILNNKTITYDDLSPLSSPYKSVEALIRYVPDLKQKHIIYKVFNTLSELYNKYFNYDVDYINKIQVSIKFYLNNLKKFVKEFEIMPYIMNETFLVTYFNMIVQINEKEIKEEGSTICKVIDDTFNYGIYFSLDNFCLMIIHFSLVFFSKIVSYNEEACESTKLIIFLEKLDNSKGMKYFIDKLSTPSSSKLSLLLSKQMINNLGEEIEKEIKANYSDKYMKKMNLISSDSSLKKTSELIDIKEIITQPEGGCNEIIEKHITNLSRTFLYFCHKGDKLNFNRMTLSSYIKFLKHCKLFREITQKEKEQFFIQNVDIIDKKKDTKKSNLQEDHSMEYNKELTINDLNYKKTLSKIVNSTGYSDRIGESEVNIIFSSLTGPKNLENYSCQNTSITVGGSSYVNINDKPKNDAKMLRMSFEQFIQSFNLICQRIYPNEQPKGALQKMLTNSIIPNLFKEENQGKQLYTPNIKSAFNKLEDQSIRTFLHNLNESASSIFGYFCDQYNQVSFENYFEFYKDFGLFPEMVNLTRLKNIFFIFNEMNKNESDSFSEKILIKGEITYCNFLESLVITGMISVFDKNYTDIEKILYIIERLNQSNGINKLKNRFGREK